MKKLLLSAILLFALSFNANAQELGVRWGNIGFNDFGLDAIIGLGRFDRVHADVAFGGGNGQDVGVDALFDFAYRPLGSTNLNWYAGIGPSLSFGNDLWFGASGEIGLEYHFQGIPLVLGADYRPTYWFTPETEWGADGWGVNLRWRFGQRN